MNSRPPSIMARLARRGRALVQESCRRGLEALGVDRMSRVARDDLDRKLAEFLPDRGFFIEAGALDGLESSNTYFLERLRGWRGLLVEPNAMLASACRRRRRRSIVVQAALTDPEASGGTVELTYGHDLSWVEGAYEDEELANREAILSRYGYGVERIQVPAIAISELLDHHQCPAVDFFSLDVEGFEVQVLKGLDLNRHRPTYILVECQTEQAKLKVEKCLMGYKFVSKMSRHDYLFRDVD